MKKELTSKERMTAWKNLPEPKPSWENFKFMLGGGETPESALKRWREWDKKGWTASSQRSKLVMELGSLRQDLGFLQPDIRYKWNQKELIDKIEHLQHRINQKEFF